MPNLDDIRQSALSLSAEERAALAQELLASLDDLSEEEASRLWLTEAERRLKQLEDGDAQAVPAEKVHEEAEKLLRG